LRLNIHKGMNLMKIVNIKWIDSSTAPIGWEYRDELLPLKPAICETVGYVTEKTKQYITICSTISETQILGRITIPRKSILKMSKL